MPEEWLSVAQAAATMKCHPRTIERRIAASKIESRRNDDGQVQVLVDVPDVVDAVSSDTLDTVRELADRQVDIAAGSASALVRLAQDQTIRAENQLVLARQDAGRYRQAMKVSVISLGVTLVLVIGAVGWCTYTITAVHAEAQHASDAARLAVENSARLADNARQAETTANAERRRASAAEVEKAKAEGELAAYKTELSGVVTMAAKNVPATRPSTFLERITQAFVGRE